MNHRSFLAAGLLAAILAACAGGPPPLDLSGTRVAVPPVPKWAELRRLLAASQYEALDETLERYRAASLWDIENGEEPLILAYEAFEVADRAVHKQLHRWVQQRPKSWHALTARAFCNFEIAADVRGTGWIEDVQENRVELMRQFHKFAGDDARAALVLQPRNIGPHHVLVRIARHYGETDAGKAALQAFPASYMLRFQEAWSLQPRWRAGKLNYEPIDTFVKASQEHAAANPRLRRLMGMPYWARGQDFSTDGNYEEAVGMYNAALAFGEVRAFYDARAYAAGRKGDLRRAFSDAKRNWELRARVDDNPGPGDTMREVLKSARVWTAAKLAVADLTGAIAAMDVVLEHVPDDTSTMMLRAVARCRDDQVPSALKDLERVSVLQPAMQVDRLRSACLAGNGKPEEEIKRRQAQILKASGNGQAHYELAALYTLVADLPSTVVAYRYACELKHPDACQRIVELQKIADRTTRLPWPADLRSTRVLHDQERLPGAADYDAFMAKLAASPEFTPGGQPVRFVRRPFPAFPTWVRGVERGSVDVTVYFNTDGSVAGAAVNGSEPQGYFELAAITAVLQWRIEPRPTGLKASQRFEFKMPPDRPADDHYQELLAVARTPEARL